MSQNNLIPISTEPVPQYQGNVDEWAVNMTAYLTNSSNIADATALAFPIQDGSGRTIIDETGIYLYDSFDTLFISPDIVQIDTTHLVDAAITTAKLANLAVDVNKLADLSVEAAKLANSSVTSTKIANLAVGSAAIANAAVGTAHIANAAITSALIGDAQIVTAKIDDLAVNNAKIANAAIDSAKIANAAITNAHIVNAAIDNLKITNTLNSADFAFTPGVTATGWQIFGAQSGVGSIVVNELTVVDNNGNVLLASGSSMSGVVVDDITTAQSTADTGVTNAATAQGAADTAQTAAVNAQSTADTAVTNASTAQSAADAAQTAADSAQTTANTANTAAGTAQTAADTAQTAADSAQTTANTANSAAGTAQTAADSAQGTANTANTAAGTAQTAADAAQGTADTAQTNASTAQTAADAAQTDATTAQTSANAAQTDATAAQAAADAAQADATAALADAATAIADAATAISNAAAAQADADQGIADAATAASSAGTAITNAATAQTTADDAITDAATALAAANSAEGSPVFYQTTTPATTGPEGSVWIHSTTKVMRMLRGTVWETVGFSEQITAANITTFIAGASIGNAQIGNAAIGTAQIQNLGVTTALIGTAAITTAKIANAAITTALIDTAAITTALIANAAVTTALIDTAAITTAKIANAAITTALIETGAITTALIANAAITNALIENGAITQAKIGTAAIGSAEIADTIQSTNFEYTAGVSAAGWRITGTQAGGGVFEGTEFRLYDSSGNLVLNPQNSSGAVFTAITAAGLTADWLSLSNRPVDADLLNSLQAWGDLQSIPSNLDTLVGTEDILNNLVSLSASGVLSGGGGGAVTISGLGFVGDLDANNFNNTNQLTDGANLGGTADWNNVLNQPTLGAIAALSVIDGTYISDGAIVTDLLAADAIVAGKIAAGAIVTAALAANAVVASKIAANSINVSHLNIATQHDDVGNSSGLSITFDPYSAVPMDISRADGTSVFAIQVVDGVEKAIVDGVAGDNFITGLTSIHVDVLQAINKYYLGDGDSDAATVGVTQASGSVAAVALTVDTGPEGTVIISYNFTASDTYVTEATDQGWAAPNWTVEVRRDSSTGTILNSQTFVGSAANTFDTEGALMWYGNYSITAAGNYVDKSAPVSGTEVYYVRLLRNSGEPTTLTRNKASAEAPSFETNVLDDGAGGGYSWTDKDTGYTRKSGSFSVPANGSASVTFSAAFTTLYSATATAVTTDVGSENGANLSGVSATGLTIYNSESTARTCYWQADGHTT